MPWSGGAFTRTNGVHTGSTLWVQDRDAGTKILAARHDTHDQDLAGGINSTLEKSGSNAATGNLNIGSNRLTAVADGTAKTDAATVNQLQSNAPAFQATDTGTANAHVIALSPAITAYAAGQAITFKSGAASTTASTVNVNGLGVKAIKKKNDQDIAAGDIESGSIVTVVYDGTNFQMTSQLAADDGLTIGGSNTQVQYNNSGALAGDADFTFDGSNVSLAKALYLADGAVATPSVANTGDVNTGIYFPAADTMGVVTGGVERFRFGSNPIPGKNLIRNGAVPVSQRGVNATILSGFDSTTNSYIADGFLASGGGTPQNRADLKHVSSGGPTGFPNFIRYDITTAESAVAAGESSIIQQRIEGFNLQSIQAASGVVALTLQFYMRSPKTGTHCVYLSTQNTRNVVKEFTVAVADTWEKHTLSFVADTSGGTVSNAATEFLRVGWPIIAGSTFQGTADAWTASNIFATSNQQNLADNTANNIDITGVQLEVGSVATDFAHQSYAQDLAACQRYFFRAASGTNGPLPNTAQTSTTGSTAFFALPTTMRADPTLAYSDLSHFGIAPAVTQVSPTALSITYVMESAVWVSVVWSAGSGAAGEAPRFYTIHASATLDFIAEL